MLSRHRRITEIALGAAGRFGFALAGGYAVSAHGMGNRMSGDVDLFTAWHSRESFPQAVDAVIHVLTDEGHRVDVLVRNDTFARLLIRDMKQPEGFFADALGALEQITDADFDCYGFPSADLAAMRERFADWRRQILG